MRSRQGIEEDFERVQRQVPVPACLSPGDLQGDRDRLLLEVLLDIRDWLESIAKQIPSRIDV